METNEYKKETDKYDFSSFQLSTAISRHKETKRYWF